MAWQSVGKHSRLGAGNFQAAKSLDGALNMLLAEPFELLSTEIVTLHGLRLKRFRCANRIKVAGEPNFGYRYRALRFSFVRTEALKIEINGQKEQNNRASEENIFDYERYIRIKFNDANP